MSDHVLRPSHGTMSIPFCYIYEHCYFSCYCIDDYGDDSDDGEDTEDDDDNDDDDDDEW